MAARSKRWNEPRYEPGGNTATPARSVALLAPTNDTVDRLNQRAQQARMRAGELDPDEPQPSPRRSTSLYVGDEIATRRNDRRLLTDRGDMVRNRARWTITAIHPDDGLTVTGPAGTVTLPAGYVAEHVELGYATHRRRRPRPHRRPRRRRPRPSHRRPQPVRPHDPRPATNDAFIALHGEDTAVDVFARCIATDWIDQPAHARRAELVGIPVHRVGLLDGPGLRALVERRHHLQADLDRALARQERLPAETRHTRAQQANAEHALAQLDERRRHARQVIDEYDRPLRRRRHQHELEAARRELADLPHLQHDAQQQLDAAGATLTDLRRSDRDAKAVLARRPDIQAELDEVAQQLGADLRIRTRVTRLEQPDNIVSVLGPRPAGRDARAWDDTAGLLAQHQAAFDIIDGLGRTPFYLDNSAHTDSHHAITARLGNRQRTQERGLELEGLSIDL